MALDVGMSVFSVGILAPLSGGVVVAAGYTAAVALNAVIDKVSEVVGQFLSFFHKKVAEHVGFMFVKKVDVLEQRFLSIVDRYEIRVFDTLPESEQTVLANIWDLRIDVNQYLRTLYYKDIQIKAYEETDSDLQLIALIQQDIQEYETLLLLSLQEYSDALYAYIATHDVEP